MYDELSVKNLWPHMQGIPEFMIHFPDKLPKNRLPDRKYFFTIMNTLNDDYVAQLIANAHSARYASEGVDK